MTTLIRRFLFLLCFSTCPLLAAAAATLESPAQQQQLVLIANPQAGITALSQEEAINLFMGRHLQLSSGIAARPVDFRPLKPLFYRALIDKTLAEVNAYWARLVFSGRASPPVEIGEPGELLQFVADNKGAVGYMYRAQVDGRVRIVGELSVGELNVSRQNIGEFSAAAAY